MSQTRSRLMSEIYAYCGEPSDLPLNKGGLPQELVFQVLCENEDEMLRDLGDSSVGPRVVKEEVYLQGDQAEITLGINGNAAAYVQLQPDASTDIRLPVEIVKPSSLLQAAIDGKLAIAFHENMQTAESSWKPDAQQVLTIWYDREGDEKTKAGPTEIGSLYDSYLKLRTAAQCRELMNLEIGGILKSRLARSEEQWRRHVNKGQQEGMGYKSRVFTPPRFRRNFPFLDRTRFFVP